MKANLDQSQLIAQLHRLAAQAKSGATASENSVSSPATADFGNLLNKAIDTVNQYQMESGKAAAQIESGDGGASLVKAMIASQKASVAFQATVQVRNKVVSAYQDIMNMPL